MEPGKWQEELKVFSKVVNTVVMTGNVTDQYPVIRDEKMLGMCSLEIYLAQYCVASGYQGVLFYNPVQGFHCNGWKQDRDPVFLTEQAVKAINDEINDDSEKIRFTKGKDSQGQNLLRPLCVESAARIISYLLEFCNFPIALIVSFSSRLSARPDDLDIDERMVFMNFQEGAVNSRRNRTQTKDSTEGEILRNELFLIADKINDLPAWFYLSHPSLKNIEIPKPDFRMRSQLIDCYASSYPGFNEATETEKSFFLDTFVGSTEGFTNRDLGRVIQIAQMERIGVNNVDKAILLYKHGVQENPWMKLDAGRLKDAEERIKKRVLGQDVVVKAAVDIVKRAAMGMSGLQHSSSSSKPRGILFLAGPTGTGKTELAKALTELIFLDERNMIRFDMSEYRQPQSDQRLLGAPPGYVGYEAGGQLTNAVREHPFSVLLFDEIEKADPSVLDKFLQILEDGRITDGRGDTVYLQDCLIIFTSNLGIKKRSGARGEEDELNVRYDVDREYQVVHDKILAGVKSYFNDELGRPELLNRIGNNILVFDFIREDSLKPIIAKQIANISGNLWAEKKIKLTVSPDAEEALYNMAVAALPEGQGGRGVGNMMEEMLINPLARYLFDEDIKRDSSVTVEEICKVDGVAEIKASNSQMAQT